ncbi:hypothetical protein NOVOSPHI9U_460007 [Novosphingobium sp. 9U]|nr:hypothetical protein NOVOSPHI9U_460007 [Novosphingobium sp. 9U]
MADGAVPGVDRAALLEACSIDAIGGIVQRVHCQVWRCRGGQLRLAVEREGEQPAWLGAELPPGIEQPAAIAAAPVAYQHRHVLLAAHHIADRRTDDPQPGIELPQPLAVRSVVGSEQPIRGTLEHQSARGRQRAAVPQETVIDPPTRLLRHWVPGDQRAFAVSGVSDHRRNGEAAEADLVRCRMLGDVHAQLHRRDVDEAGLGAEGHALPVVPAELPRPDRRIAMLVADACVLDRAAGLQVDAACPGHLAELLGRDGPAGLAVDHIEESVRRRLHQHLAWFAGDLQRSGDDIRGRLVVPCLARVHLVVPQVLARLCLERDDRGEIEVVPGAGIARDRVPWSGVAGAEIDPVELRIVGHAVPHRASAAGVLPEFRSPGLRCRLHGRVASVLLRAARHCVEAPALLPGLLVISGDVAAFAVVGAAMTDQHQAIEGDRRAGDGAMVVLLHCRHAPAQRPCGGVERQQPPVERAREHQPVGIGAAAMDREHDLDLLGIAPDFWIVRPAQLAAQRIGGVDLRVAAGEVQRPADRQRRRLQRDLARQFQRPGEAEARDVAGVHLLEPAVAALVVGPAMRQPVLARSARRIAALTAGRKQGENRQHNPLPMPLHDPLPHAFRRLRAICLYSGRFLILETIQFQ